QQKEISGEVLGQVRQVDAVVHVVRAFESSAVPHVLDSIEPRRDMGETVSEMLFADLAQCEKRMKALVSLVTKVTKTQEQDKKEQAVLERLHKDLEQGKVVKQFKTNNDDEAKIISAF